MCKQLIFFVILFIISLESFGQSITQNNDDSMSSDTLDIMPESMEADIDSLLNSFHGQYFTRKNEYCHDDEENVVFDDSTYIERLSRLPRVIDLPYNQTVRSCIDLYVNRKKGLLRYILGMADFYFPMIEQTLDANALPIELKYLAVVESALNPKALSRVGASGLWQFMLPTGKSCGLEINSLIDERRDPKKSTIAVCKYFKQLYAIYGDWHLVLASYNCGPGNVNRAIRRAGGKSDFWAIYPYLPKETRMYVPLFIAINYAMNYHCDHNICPIESSMPAVTDTVMINKTLHFQQISEILNLDIEQIRSMNPQYTRDIIPGNVAPQVLNLPLLQTYSFVDKEDTIYVHKAEELLAYIKEESKVKEKITYKVQANETLYTIANQYGITAKDIRGWNKLNTNKVAKGTRLTLYINNGGLSFVNLSDKGNPVSAKEESKSKNNLYKVKSGDSLYLIAKKYPGVSTKDLQAINNLENEAIRPGQLLKIPQQ